MSIIPRMIRGGGYMTPKGGAASQYDEHGEQHNALAKVGSGDSDLWGRIEGRKALIDVTYQTGCSGDVAIAEVSPQLLGRLKVGSVVRLALVNGDPNNAYVDDVVDVSGDGYPDTVCGVMTGAELASDIDTEVPPAAPVPLWTWTTTGAGRLWALETGAGGDVLIHSGAGMEVVADVVQIRGKVVIGSGMLTPPVGRMAGVEDVEGGEVPGVAAVPQPLNLIQTGTVPPYVGDQDSVVRVVDRYQVSAGTDQAFMQWLASLGVYLAALDVYLAVVAGLNPVAIAAAKLIFDAVPKPGVPPTTIISEAMSGSDVLRVSNSVV
jgi:hypothetical protein